MDDLILQDLYTRIFQSAVVAIGVTDRSGKFVAVNQAWTQYLGYDSEDAKLLRIRDITPESDIAESDSNYSKLLNREIECFSKIKQYKRRNGELFWADLNVSGILDDNNKVVAVLGIFVNIDQKVKADQYQYDMNCMLESLNDELVQANVEISRKNNELQQAYTELERLARTDVLTGLYNRRTLDGILQKEINRSRRSGRTFFIAIADIDNFKRINDTYGHDCGDEVLKIVSEIFLHGGIRGTDYVGRWGGEEFLFILTETHYKGAYTVLERIRKDVADRDIEYKGQNIKISITIGFSYQKNHYNTDEMISEADKALYKGKNNGKNQVLCFFD